MAYQNRNQGQSQQGGKFGGSSAGGPKAAQSAAPAVTKHKKGEGNPPAYDVCVVGEDGKVLKDDRGYSVRCGAIWLNEDGSLYIKMDEGSPVRIFSREKKAASAGT